MNIANILHLKNVPFTYETPLFAEDGTMYLPDFTLTWKGETLLLGTCRTIRFPEYKKHWKEKEKWYDENFPGKLIVTYESNLQSKDIEKILKEKLEIQE